MRMLAALLLAGLASAPASPAPSCWLELRLHPRNAEEEAFVRELDEEAYYSPERGFTAYVPESELAAIAARVPFEIVHADVEGFYRERLAKDPAPAGTLAASFGPGSMGGYHTLAETIAGFDALAAAYPSELAPRRQIGSSVEGRPIWAYKLSARASLDEDEPEVLLVALMHAREPIGMMSLAELAVSLLSGQHSDPEARYLLEHRELWLVPVLNPDGYVHNELSSPQGGGMWRKNRRLNPGGSYGVDLNRNFSYEWGRDDRGSSPNATSGTYRGSAPFSEPETRALRDFVIERRPRVAVNTHAYGDYLLRPWAYEDALTPDDPIFEDVGRVAVRGNGYALGNAWRTLGYLANGDHDAYMYGDLVDKPSALSVTPEIGDASDGFWPGGSRIAPLVAEALPMHRFHAWVAGPTPRVLGYRIDDSSGGDGDSHAEPGELVDLQIDLRNHGLAASYGPLLAELASDACAIRVEGGGVDLGVVAAQTSLPAGSFRFPLYIASGAEPGQTVTLRLGLRDDRGAYPEQKIEILLGEPVVALAEDLENGAPRIARSGFSFEAAGGSRPGSALSDSPGSSYAANLDATATLLDAFDLRAAAHAYLVFEQRFWIDNDFDAASVEVSLDAGATWQAVAGLQSDRGSGSGRQVAGAPVYDGRLVDWRTERVDLTPFRGEPDVRVRLRLQSNGSIHKDGWLVDDLRLLVFPSVPPLRVPSDPAPLRAVKRGPDVALAWPVVASGPQHDRADGYVLYRSDRLRATSGFAELTAGPVPLALDPGAAAAARSFAYQAVAENCAGLSSLPPP